MSDSNTIEVSQFVHASPEEVCRGFTHETLLRDWLCSNASTDPRKEGYIVLSWADRLVTGIYDRYDPPRSLGFTWQDSTLSIPGRVDITTDRQEDGTLLTLSHTFKGGLENLDGAGSQLVDFWRSALENLASVVETGIDLRFTRRPRLGIFMDELTPELIARLGVPVDYGVWIEGTAEGTGAREAGLVKDDVLISLNGVKLMNPQSFEVALKGLNAGDSPIVEYYRKGEKVAIPLTLGSFPIPEPATPAVELAARVRELDAEILSAIRAQVSDIGDEEAAVRPADNEWSVKELVAHFVLCERDYQSWVADMLNDTPVQDWLEMRPNVQPRITSLVARLGSLPALLEELSAAKEETAAMIEAFPESFTRDRKHLYRRAIQWEVDGLPQHYYEEHRDQFQIAIEAAKA